jgi:hypothetical protein
MALATTTQERMAAAERRYMVDDRFAFVGISQEPCYRYVRIAKML